MNKLISKYKKIAFTLENKPIIFWTRKNWMDFLWSEAWSIQILWQYLLIFLCLLFEKVLINLELSIEEAAVDRN
jgi:hypothetical protein